ncbi:hypothetical protein [Streptococcus pneumoniae]
MSECGLGDAVEFVDMGGWDVGRSASVKLQVEVVSGGGGALQGTGALCLEAESTGAGRTGAVSENATSLL